MKTPIFIKSLLLALLTVTTVMISSAQVKIGDNLGTHKADKDLNMNQKKILNVDGVAIGSATLGNSSVSLELAGNDKAILFNRVATLAAVVTPVDGMAVYNNQDNKFYVRQNGAWVTFGTMGDIVVSLTAASVGTTPNANGLVLSSNKGDITITLQPADENYPGVLTAVAQKIGGDKDFTGNTKLNNVTVTGAAILSGLTLSNDVNDVILVQDATGAIKKSALIAGSINKLLIDVPVGTSASFTEDNVMVTVTLTISGVKKDDGVVVNFLSDDQSFFTGLSIMSAIATADNTVKVIMSDIRNPQDPSFAPVAIDGKKLNVTFIRK